MVGQLDDAHQEGDPGRPPGQRPGAQPARLRPAAQQDQRLHDVARQEVAVDRLEARLPGVLDAAVGDLDRLGPTADEVQHGGQVGRHPEERVGVVDLPGGGLGLAQELDRGVRVASPGERDGERGRGVDLLVAGGWPAGARDPDGVAREPLGVGEQSVQHRHLRERGEDRRPLRGRVARDQLHGAASGGARAHRIAGRPADQAQPLVEEADADAVAAGIERADRRFQVCRRA